MQSFIKKVTHFLFLDFTDGKTVTIKGDFATKANKIEIKDNANTVFTTYINENKIGEVQP